MEKITIRIRTTVAENEGTGKQEDLVITCDSGTPGETLIPHFGSLPGTLVAIKVNNEILSLSERLDVNAVVEPILLETHEGAVIYRRSLAFLLAVAARELFPNRRLYVGHSLGRSYYYTFFDGKNPEPQEIELLAKRMRSLAENDTPITNHYVAYAEALELFEKNNQDDTALLLTERSEPKVLVNQCGGFNDLYIAPLLHRT
ncbi:MAG: nucleoside kinase, partial [Treponema sp.]|nr:nucleoside kinase [Treponema sp.]